MSRPNSGREKGSSIVIFLLEQSETIRGKLLY